MHRVHLPTIAEISSFGGWHFPSHRVCMCRSRSRGGVAVLAEPRRTHTSRRTALSFSTASSITRERVRAPEVASSSTCDCSCDAEEVISAHRLTRSSLSVSSSPLSCCSEWSTSARSRFSARCASAVIASTWCVPVALSLPANCEIGPTA